MKKTNRAKRAMTATMAAAVLTMAFSASAFAATGTSAKGQEDVVMMVGQSKAWVGSQEVTSASAPVMMNNTTYVPLRFVSENFGADVKYDSNAKAVTIVVDGKTYTIKLNESKAESASGSIDLGAKVQMKDGSVLVPMRAIVEKILDKKVSYNDGLIYISDEQKQLDDSTTQTWKEKWNGNSGNSGNSSNSSNSSNNGSSNAANKGNR